LIFLSTRLGVDEHERGQLRRTINESWKTAYHFLGRNQKRPIPDDNFLSTQFLLYIGTRGVASDPTNDRRNIRELWRMHHRDDEYKSYLLDKYFSSRNLQELPEQNPAIRLDAAVLYEYAHDIKRSVETYYRLLNPGDSSFSDTTRVQLERIRRLGWRESLALAVAAVHAGTTEEDLSTLFHRLERLLFLREIQLRFPHDEIDLIETAVRIARREEAVTTTADKILSIADKLAARIDLSDVNVRWGRERAYYGWSGLKYLLFEYEQELKRKSKSDRDKLIWEEFTREIYEKDYSTIEHIYPQKPRDDYWTDRFSSFTTKQRNALRNSLGNLLAVSRAKNSSLSNRAFPEKRDGGPESGGYRYGSYSEIDVANESDWTPTEISRRGLRILDFLERRWSVKLGDRTDKMRALKLEFLDESAKARPAELTVDDAADHDEADASET
jgi:hypothetical protein